MISFDELAERSETETNDEFRFLMQSLLTALNDWPTPGLHEPRDLLHALNNEIKKPLTFDNLKSYSDELKIHTSGNAWKMESITSLLDMFDTKENEPIDKELTLDKIIGRLTNHLRMKC